MNPQIVLAILLGLAAAAPQKKAVDPKKDIKFDNHTEEKHHVDQAVEKEHHDEVAHEVDHHDHVAHDLDHHGHHNDLNHHAIDHHDHEHHAIDHHLAAQHQHKLLHHAHALAEHEHAYAHHVLPHHPPVFPMASLDKHTSYLLVPLPSSAVIPVKPGALYDPHVKKHALFVPAAHH